MPAPYPLPSLDQLRPAIVGLGYVGLPLAAAFGANRPTLGFDINCTRVGDLQNGIDSTGEVSATELSQAKHLRFSCNPADLADCNVYVVAVPTPIDHQRQPNLAPLLAASELLGRLIKPGDIVIYESTVYPGATEDDCIPVIERVSGLCLNVDFFAGYSPERINPGDKTRPLTQIRKVTSGSTPEVADLVDALYATIITAGTFKATSIRVAEAAKIIENTQRDVNIALINELSIVFSHLGIDTTEVLDAAATKWNFIRFSPGLVGGHCIGVDPYYLVHKSIAAGHIPDIIRQAREINDGMALHSTSLLVKAMIAKGCKVLGARVLVCGLTFKENCSDTRNSKVFDLVKQIKSYGMRVDVWDPWTNSNEVAASLDGALLDALPPEDSRYDALILAVAHRDFAEAGARSFRSRLHPEGVLFDMKSMFARTDSDLRL